ncbi:MAG: hypothetical protein ACXWWC_06710 [Chitinophagaceae bacterium]
MLQYIFKHSGKFGGIFILMLSAITLQAQEKVELDTKDVASWFESNWMWVAAGVIILLMIILFSRGKSGHRKTTTVIKDAHGKTKSVTTTEEQI